MKIKLTRYSGAVDTVDHVNGKIEGHAGGVKLQAEGLTVEQALRLAEASPEMLQACQAVYDLESSIYRALDGYKDKTALNAFNAAFSKIPGILERAKL